MDITIQEQQVFWVEASVPAEQARERVWDHKIEAFGTMAWLRRPKADEIKVAASAKRFDPVWHLVIRKRLAFNRHKEYRVPVAGPNVREVTAGEASFPVVAGPPAYFVLRGLEHCLEETVADKGFDAVSGAETAAGALAAAQRHEIDDPQAFAPPDALVVQPAIKASSLVQREVQKLITPYEADEVLEDAIEVEHLHLLYHPVYAFEFAWESRSKKAVVELDGVTGEVRTDAKWIGDEVRRVFTSDVLLDIGADTINIFIPGGSIPLRIGKALLDRRKDKSP